MKEFIVLLLVVFIGPARAEISDDQALASAKRISEMINAPVALLKVDPSGQPIQGAEIFIIGSESKLQQPSQTEANEHNSIFEFDLEGSLVLGIPNMPAGRLELKSLKRTLGVGVEAGTLMGSTVNARFLLNLTPLASVGVENVYIGYRVYAIKTTWDVATADTSVLYSLVGFVVKI